MRKIELTDSEFTLLRIALIHTILSPHIIGPVGTFGKTEEGSEILFSLQQKLYSFGNTEGKTYTLAESDEPSAEDVERVERVLRSAFEKVNGERDRE